MSPASRSVLLHPDTTLRSHVDQLGRDSHAIVDSSEAGLEQIHDPELTPDLVGALRRALVVHRRRACDDSKARGLSTAQVRDHLLRQPVTQIILFGIASKVLERQHGQHDSCGRRGRPHATQVPGCVAASDDQRHRTKGKRRLAPDECGPSRLPQLGELRWLPADCIDIGGHPANRWRCRVSLHRR